MFEAAEVGRRLNKADYKRELQQLRADLLQAQFAMQKAGIAMLLIIEGVDNSTKGEVVNLLNEWLDARGMRVHAFGPKSDEERDRPRLWRYWAKLPEHGRIALFAGSWYTGPLMERTFNKRKNNWFDRYMNRLANQERMLALDGMLVLKFWLHLSYRHQDQRFEALKNEKGSRWIVSDHDRRLHKHYKPYCANAERMIRQTDLWLSPWVVLESEDKYYRNLTLGKTVLAAMQRRLQGSAPEQQDLVPGELVQLPSAEAARRSVLDNIDMAQRLAPPRYERELKKYQQKLIELSWEAYHRQVTSVIVFEGWDAAGKGSAIRRLTQAIDARIARVIQVAAPTDEERAQHYLWRFWRHLPRAGHVTIYDRSWYGRVLVERVEGFAKDSEWQRAYAEINDFEEQLYEHGVVLNKFWLHIDPDEQMRRFKEREKIPYKQHKITEEDWRNRDRWGDYEVAVNEMVERTSTEFGPWHLIAANDKPFARVQVLKQVCGSLQKALKSKRNDKRS